MTTSDLNQMVESIVSEVLLETKPQFEEATAEAFLGDGGRLSVSEAIAKSTAICNQYIVHASAAVTARMLVTLGLVEIDSPER